MLQHKEINKSQEKTKKHLLLEIKDYLDARFELRRNNLTLEIEIRPIDDKDYKIMDEAFFNSLWLQLQLDGFKVSENILSKILNSHLTKSYNPLEVYFENLPKHDYHDYIRELAETLTVSNHIIDGVCLKDLWYPYLKKWLVGSVASALGKGVNHLCLILVGGQGLGKTTWLNKLCPDEVSEYLVCSHINPTLTDQNTANYLAEKWFVNIDDQLETIFGKDFNSMKAIITAPSVTNRKTWHRFTKKRKRVCSFMGSVNEPKFLTDTENRRYLVFSVDDIDLEADLKMNKVWAQALSLFMEGYAYWFDRTEIEQLNKVNEIYRQIPPEEEWLLKMYTPCKPSNPRAKFMMPSEMLSQVNMMSGLRMSSRKLSKAMDKLGFGEAISKRIGGNPRKVYAVIERNESDEREFQRSMVN